MSSRNSFSDRFYSVLLRVLPFDFRSEFGSEMQDVFRDQRDDIERSGFAALLGMWWATIADILRMAPREHWNIIVSDARYAFRLMRKNPGFTFAAVLVLGLGIGANTTIFSMVNSVLLNPLPYIDGDHLVVLRQPEKKLGTEDAYFSVDEIEDYRQRSRSLSGLVEYHTMTFTLLEKDDAHRVRSGVVSAEFFDLFGVRPLLGRTFVKSDERRGAEPVLVLSYEFWMQVEGGNPHIVGKTYELNDRVHTVIGVLPSIPQYPDENDVYMPTTSCPMRSNPDMMRGRDARMMRLFGRLKGNETPQHSGADITAIAQQMHKEFPNAYPSNAGLDTTVSLLRDDLTKQARPLLLLLWGAAGFVLLIACANVANLIMGQMARREHELMIRVAVGAGNHRLLRQLLTESFLLALLASGIGLFFAFESMHLLKDFATQLTPRAREITIDHGVLAYTILCAMFTTILFGSIAAMHSRQHLFLRLKEVTGSGSRNMLRKVLIAAQVAFSCVLLIGAGLLVRSFVKVLQVDPGFRPQSVYAARINLNGDKFDNDEKHLALANRIQQKLASLPGVSSAALSSSFPLDEENQLGGGRPVRFQVEGDPRPESELPPVTTVRRATPDYFRTLSIPLIVGRTFLSSDDAKAPAVVLLNQALAVKRFGKDSPVGKRITMDNGQNWMTIVGVVGNVKEFGLNRETPFQIYRPLAQQPFFGTVLVRSSVNAAMAQQIRRALREVEPQMAIVRIETMEQARAKSLASPRTLTHLFSLFAVLALVIAVAGIGSMLALWVGQRTREIGVRMALGATCNNILASVIRQGLALAIGGMALGTMIALLLTRLLTTQLFQVKPTDITTYLFALALLLGAALLVCYFPARRAARTDPQTALRCE